MTDEEICFLFTPINIPKIMLFELCHLFVKCAIHFTIIKINMKNIIHTYNNKYYNYEKMLLYLKCKTNFIQNFNLLLKLELIET